MTTNWSSARKAARSKVLKTPVNPTQTVLFAPKDADAICAAIESAYPDLSPDLDAVRKAGAGKDGGPQKLAVYTRPADKASGIKAANVTLYGSGKAVYCNLQPV
jgi:hypothetical protein